MTALPRFAIGQAIWIGDFSPVEPVYETCPDCGGTGRLRVTFHDDTQVSINCQNCMAGYDPPTGRIIVHRISSAAREATVCGLESVRGKTRWHVGEAECAYRIVDDEEAFETEAEALAYAAEAATRYEAEQRARIVQKEKDSRSWAWNASYHRKKIKDAKREIEYHTAKLNAAAIKAKGGDA